MDEDVKEHLLEAGVFLQVFMGIGTIVYGLLGYANGINNEIYGIPFDVQAFFIAFALTLVICIPSIIIAFLCLKGNSKLSVISIVLSLMGILVASLLGGTNENMFLVSLCSVPILIGAGVVLLIGETEDSYGVYVEY